MSDAPSPEEPFAPIVCERKLSRRAQLVLLLTVLWVIGGSAGIEVFQSEIKSLTRSLSMSLVGYAGTLALLFAIAWLPLPYMFRQLSLRFGRCSLRRDMAVFRFALVPIRLFDSVVPYSDIDRWEATPHGLVVRLKHASANVPGLAPWLIPTHDDEDLARVLRLLERAVGESTEAPRVFGRASYRPAHFFLGGLAFVATILPCFLVAVVRFAPDTRWPLWRLLPLDGALAVGCVVILGLMLLPLTVTWFQPVTSRVVIGHDSLAMGPKWFPFEDLVWIGVGDDYVACAEAGFWKGLAWVGPDAPKVRELLERDLPAGAPRVAAEMTEWSSRRGRRWRRVLAAAAYVAVAIGITGTAVVAPNSRFGFMRGERDQGLHLVYDADAERVVAVAVGEEPYRPLFVVPGSPWDQHLGFQSRVHRFQVEATREGSCTLIYMGPDGTSRSHTRTLSAVIANGPFATFLANESVPEFLERVAPELARDPVLGDFVTGRGSRRVYDVSDGTGTRLLWAVDRREVKLVVVAPDDLGFVAGPDAFQVERTGSGRVDVGETHGMVQLMIDGSVTELSAELPAFDALLVGTRRVRGGETVRTVVTDLVRGAR